MDARHGRESHLMVLGRGLFLDSRYQAPHIVSHLQQAGRLGLVLEDFLHLGLVAKGLSRGEAASQKGRMGKVNYHRDRLVNRFGAYSMKGIIRPCLALDLLFLEDETVNNIELKDEHAEVLRAASFDMSAEQTAKALYIKKSTVQGRIAATLCILSAQNIAHGILLGFQTDNLGLEDLPINEGARAA